MAVQRIQELIGLMQKNLECSICLELMKSPVATKCEHYFCRFCLTEFLEKKRSVPCPLCKQPITKRSLKDKGELNNIVSAVGNLISSFQYDSGVTYSPPTGPQTFFPCTPDTINTKPESHQVKSKKNVRRSSRSSKHTAEESPSDTTEVDNSLLLDDGFAVPQAPRTSNVNSARRSHSATRICTSPSSVNAEAGTSGQARGRPRSRTRAAAVTTDSDTNNQLLQYLDENSCGLQTETQIAALSASEPFGTTGQEKSNGKTSLSDVEAKDEKALGTRTYLETEECRVIRTAKTVNIQRNEILHVVEVEIVECKTSTSGRETEQTAGSSLDDKEKRSHNKEEQSGTNCEKKLSKQVSRNNAKNLETRPETDKENFMEPRTAVSSKRINDEHKNLAFANSSQNSSDDSVSSKQQFQQPLPAVTRTYSRRSAGRNIADKVEKWMACLPSGQSIDNKQKPQSDQISEQNQDGCSPNKSREKEGRRAEIVQDTDVTVVNSINTESSENEKGFTREASNEEGHKTSTTSIPEQDEEFMLTPPIRKKRIFKRKNVKNDQDSDSPTIPFEENSPPADPYVFVVGHTPVAKSKKRGRPRSKEKAGKPQFVNPFNLNASDKKIVRFSDASLEITSNTSLFNAENKKDQTQADAAPTTSDQICDVEKIQDTLPPDTDSVIACSENAEESSAPFVKPGTRSRVNTRSKRLTTQKSSSGENKGITERRSTQRKVSKRVESPEAEKIREEQTQQLASWIGQAEDHDLLFSTQEAQASIESMHTEEKQNDNNESVCGENDNTIDRNDNVDDGDDDGAIVLMEEEESSNDGVCLIGPVHDENPSRIQSCQQEANFDIIAKEHSHSGQNESDNIKQVANPTLSSVPKENKCLTSPEPRKQEHPACDLSSLSRLSPSGPRKKVDTVPETQLSTLESPASSNIVLPSPAVGMALSKFTTRIAPSARLRSSKKGVSCEDDSVHKETVVAEVNPKPDSRKQDTTATSVDYSASMPPAVDRDSEQSLIMPSQNCTSLSLAGKATGKPVSPSAATVKSKSPDQKPVKTKDPTSSQSPRESPQSLPGRLRRRKRGSCNSSPLLTAIPSTFTEGCSFDATCITAGAKEQQENETKDVPEPCGMNARQLSSSLTKAKEEEREDSEAAGTLFSATNDSGQTGRNGLRKRQNSDTEKDLSTVQETANADPEDPDLEAGSSSTEDLDIDPAEHEFEEPDFTLQSEEIQGRFSSRQGIQGKNTQEDSVTQDLIQETESPLEIKSSLPFDSRKSSKPSESTKDCSEQVKKDTESDSNAADKKCHEQDRKKSSCNKKNTEDLYPGLDSAVKQFSQSVPSITQIPETLEANSREKIPFSDSLTQDVAGGTGYNDSQRSGKTNHTSSSTVGMNSLQSESFSSVQSQQLFPGPHKNGSKPAITSSMNSDNQTSSVSTTPSQSILQPLRTDTRTSTPETPSQSILQPVGKQLIISQSEEQVHQQESATVSHRRLEPSQEVVENKHPNIPKNTGQCERELDGLPGLAEHQTYADTLGVEGDQLVDDQTLMNDNVSSVQLEAVECASPHARSEKLGRQGEGKVDTDEHVPLKRVQTMSKLQVQDTQKIDEHSLSLLSQQVVLDSMPECKESSQAPEEKENPRISVQSTDSHPDLEQTHPSASSTSPASVKTEEKKNVDSSPSSVSPTSRNRKLAERNDDARVTGHIPSAELLPSKSPSSGCSKVISSAPARTTSFASDSDDDDAVLIVRRTKRKCFSLDGSPAESKTPLSIKRRRYLGKRRNLSEAFDKEADNSTQQSSSGLSQTSDRSEVDKIPETDQLISLVEDHEISCSYTKESDKDADVNDTDIEGSKSSNIEKQKDAASTESVKSTSNVKTSPVYPRRKTVRGLARQTGANDNADKSESGIQAGLHTSEADLSVYDASEGQHTNKRLVLVQVSDNDDPMEIDDDVSVDSGRKTLLQTNYQNEIHSRPSHLGSEGDMPIQEDLPVIFHGSGGTVDKPIIVTQSSDKCHEQKSQSETLSSVSASLNDATIPPPSFDLRFDDDDDDDTKCRGLQEQNPQKTRDSDITGEQNGSDDTIDDAESLGKRSVNKKSEQHEKQYHTVIENRTEGKEEASCEILSKNGENTTTGSQEELQSSGGSEKRTASSEEEPVVVMKKKKTAVINSDSDDSDHECDGDSEASMQLNFTSSSAVSSQSEIITTQERSKMESELERLRREICEMEAKLQAQNSSRSDSYGNRNQESVKSEAASGMVSDDSSDDEAEKFSDDRTKKRGKTRRKSSSKDKSASRIKRPRRRQRISSDEEAEDSRQQQPRQKLMDSYLSHASLDAEDPVGTEAVAEQVKGPPSPLSITPDAKTKRRDNPVTSDEDSSDLFLSPLSPSPPPPTKHSLARAEPYRRPQPLFPVDSPNVTGSRSMTKVRQSLEFAQNATEREISVDGVNKLGDLQQDSQEFGTSLSGQVKKIPESQFSASGTVNNMQGSDFERSQQGSEKGLKQNLSSSALDADDVDSSGSPLPSPLKEPVLDEGENKENMNEKEEEEELDDDDLPRWKRKKFGFISSGLDQEKMSCLRKLAEAHECKVYSKFNDYVTHVIIRTDKDSRVCERTLKYFQGIACQCWVLSYDWVLQSLAGGRFVPERQFEIQGDTVKGDDHGGPQLSRLSSSCLLEGFAFASVGVSSDMSKKELTQLLTQSGAEVVDDPWALASHLASHKLVLRCVDSEAKPPTPAEIELFDGQYKHFGLVTVAREWILDSVCTHRLQPLEEYVFNTCPNLKLPI